MRRIWRVAAAIGVALVGLVGCEKSATSVKASQPGQRRPGLWEQTVVSQGSRQTTRHCLGEGATSSFAAAIAEGARSCAALKISGTAHGFAFESACDYGEGGVSLAQATVSGDPATRYRMELTTTVTGAAAPQVNGTRTSVTTAAWKGPCPAGMQPGDIDLPDGTRIHPAAGRLAGSLK
ncbi:MAG: hypothetical protein JWP49_2216 [Phenylobacterium sp.]|nr:hypothetical protein [Phenylobacterium sp.]